jgi:hypothetical protein
MKIEDVDAFFQTTDKCLRKETPAALASGSLADKTARRTILVNGVDTGFFFSTHWIASGGKQPYSLVIGSGNREFWRVVCDATSIVYPPAKSFTGKSGGVISGSYHFPWNLNRHLYDSKTKSPVPLSFPEPMPAFDPRDYQTVVKWFLGQARVVLPDWVIVAPAKFRDA